MRRYVRHASFLLSFLASVRHNKGSGSLKQRQCEKGSVRAGAGSDISEMYLHTCMCHMPLETTNRAARPSQEWTDSFTRPCARWHTTYDNSYAVNPPIESAYSFVELRSEKFLQSPVRRALCYGSSSCSCIACPAMRVSKTETGPHRDNICRCGDI